jgi:hypothetical protein
MVEGLLLNETEVPDEERERARLRSRAHWLLALGELESQARRPALVLVAGLPGTGKSTLARRLTDQAGFQLIRSDVIRKELAGLPPNDPTPDHLRKRLYSSERNDRTYSECERRAEEILIAGGRAIVDANFREERKRKAFVQLALRLGVPIILLICEADPATTQTRLQSRKNDASDADWAVYEHAVEEWQSLSDEVRRIAYTISTTGSAESSFEKATEVLAEEGLL